VSPSPSTPRTHRSRSVPTGPVIVGLLPDDVALDDAGTIAAARMLLDDGAVAILVADDEAGARRRTLLAAAGAPVHALGGTPVVTRRCLEDGTVDGAALAELLAAVEPYRGDVQAVVATDAVAELVRFLAVLAVLDGRSAMPEYDLEDPHLKWHARPGVRAVPNAPTVVTAPVTARPTQEDRA